MRGAFGIILVIVAILSVFYLVLSNKLLDFYYTILTWFRGSGQTYIGPFQKIIEELRDIYVPMKQMIKYIEDPYSIYLEVPAAKPLSEIVEKKYGIWVSVVKDTPVSLFDCESMNSCRNVKIYPTLITYNIYYNFPKKKKMKFICEAKTSYDDFGCFSISINGVPSKYELEYENDQGILPLACLVNLTFTENSKCFDYLGNAVFWRYGFTVETTLKAYLNVSTKTYYRVLVVPLKILLFAESSNKDVYGFLGLSREQYDNGYYYGLYGFPKVDIGRLRRESGYPLVIFDNETSYELILFEIKDTEKIARVNNIQVNFYTDANLGFLDYMTMNCTNKLNINNIYYSISCEKGYNTYCKVKVNNEYWKVYRKNRESFKFNIPICILPAAINKEYTTLDIVAYFNYTYEEKVVDRINYISSSKAIS